MAKKSNAPSIEEILKRYRDGESLVDIVRSTPDISDDDIKLIVQSATSKTSDGSGQAERPRQGSPGGDPILPQPALLRKLEGGADST